MLKQSKMELNN